MPWRKGLAYAMKTLSQYGWLSRQPPEFRDRIFRAAELRQYPAGAPVHRTGEAGHGLFAVVKGVIQLGGHPVHGYPVTLWPAGPGFWFGALAVLEPDKEIGYDAVTSTRQGAILLTVPLQRARELVRDDPKVAGLLAQIVAGNARIAVKLLQETNPSLPLQTRVARLLGLLADYGETMPLVQHEIGSMLGVGRQAVGKQLLALERVGAISCDRRVITVKDRHALAHWPAVHPDVPVLP
jgi:CRP-like cAMP-binding protein